MPRFHILRRRLFRLISTPGRRESSSRGKACQPGHPALKRPQRHAAIRARDVSGCFGTPSLRVPVLVSVYDEIWAPVLVDLIYTREDPFAVEFAFQGPPGVMARWHFSRDLLLSGLHASVGAGDVRIWPSRETSADSVLFIRLGQQGAHALIATRRASVSEWLARSLVSVPVGQEMAHVDWAEEHRLLLRGT
ncbi:SsgA family sporulation/cell division regulator [Streptomyces globisporus]|uniref:SsgA family sporulation/cell division regulator n=1 Tax=Streptomyces globisporus TaxID=1908 RepID=UPI0036DCFF8B